MALAFDAGSAFGIDKPAGVGCAHLRAGHRCAIHARLSETGFPGCAAYTCHGAGTRVTQDCFGGRSWRDDPALTGPMMRAFAAARRLHGWLVLLAEAQKLPLPAAARSEAQSLVARLTPPTGKLSEGWLAEAAGQPAGDAVAAFLSSLRAIARDSLAAQATQRPGRAS